MDMSMNLMLSWRRREECIPMPVEWGKDRKWVLKEQSLKGRSCFSCTDWFIISWSSIFNLRSLRISPSVFHLIKICECKFAKSWEKIFHIYIEVKEETHKIFSSVIFLKCRTIPGISRGYGVLGS